MIIGIGIDVVHIGRMNKWRFQSGLLERYFHPKELAAARARGPAADHSLAARFAAKEAFGKALGTGMDGLRLKDIEVRNDVNGKPSIVLYKTALEQFRGAGGSNLFLSLTHESDNAIAVVVVEGGDT